EHPDRLDRGGHEQAGQAGARLAHVERLHRPLTGQLLAELVEPGGAGHGGRLATEPGPELGVQQDALEQGCGALGGVRLRWQRAPPPAARPATAAGGRPPARSAAASRRTPAPGWRRSPRAARSWSTGPSTAQERAPRIPRDRATSRG